MSILSKKNLLLAIGIGIVSGYYSFNEPLKKFHEKNKPKS